MRKPSHCDAGLTAWLRAEGYYVEPRSWVDTKGREFLAGADKSRRRHQVYDAFHGRCAVCGSLMTFQLAEWHHARGRVEGDNLSNSELRCAEHHREEHPQVRL
jgi:hypothetical protein